MTADPILDPLNAAQRAAVTAPLAPALVLAGAGSGKTRVLTHRIAWLIGTHQVSPQSILAVTFTNKAAGEMRTRVERLLGIAPGVLWIGTFHGIAHRLLRRHWREAGLIESFQIIDAEDQQRLIKKLLKAEQLDETRWVPREIQWFINTNKDAGHRPQGLKSGNDPTRAQMIRLYGLYEAACARSGVVDFAELLLRSFELWRDQPAVLQHYRQRFRHVLVDEFQDTNSIQYAWLKLLVGSQSCPFVVGDDDQSVYGWRGARVENLQQFGRDFPAAQLFRLEQNYRSTGVILAAANGLIANNAGRLGKTLWTSGAQGEPIRLYAAFNERDEAEFVCQRIREHVTRGGVHRDIAVLYRSNAQSRVFEEIFLATRVPYRVYGGLRFFERAEIKDALAYLRLLVNRSDDASFERVVNLPTRGIGAKSLETVRAAARATGSSLWEATQACLGEALGARASTAMRGFLELIERLTVEIHGLDLHEQVDRMLAATGLIEFHQRDKAERGEARAENLEELVSAARGFGAERSDTDLPPLEAFLAHVTLESGDGQADAWEDSVQMMTLHTAKGLEFPIVFLCGMEDGLFPHQRSIGTLEGLEEERRLCYVGMTRAMRQLYLTYAEQRRLHGIDNFSQPSRFIKETPEELIEEIRPRIQVSRPVAAGRFAEDGGVHGAVSYRRTGYPGRSSHAEPAALGMRLGARVRHGKFGEGVILNLEGSGPQARVQVNFERQGTKWLVMQYANLEPL